METEINIKEEDSFIRHCAHCLEVCESTTKTCNGCKKRTYCSKECQQADWFPEGDGQGHVNWCRRHECGEEDVDWEVVPIPNKGLGVRAKKLIPACLKIIVEPVFYYSDDDHSGFNDLGPEGETMKQKFARNAFLGENNNSQVFVALRIARVNHACQPNAAAIYDETARVAILFAQRDIQPGEEITICYYSPFFWLVPIESSTGETLEEEMKIAKDIMVEDYGITCPSDCSCYDPIIWALIKEGRQITTAVIDLANQHKTIEALEAGDKLVDIYRNLNVSWIYLGFTYLFLFRVAVGRSETLPKAKEYIRTVVELFRMICPYSEVHTKKYEKLLENPETHPEYMVIDKMMNNSSL